MSASGRAVKLREQGKGCFQNFGGVPLWKSPARTKKSVGGC